MREETTVSRISLSFAALNLFYSFPSFPFIPYN